jgi:hypothetical protein
MRQTCFLEGILFSKTAHQDPPPTLSGQNYETLMDGCTSIVKEARSKYSVGIINRLDGIVALEIQKLLRRISNALPGLAPSMTSAHPPGRSTSMLRS